MLKPPPVVVLGLVALADWTSKGMQKPKELPLPTSLSKITVPPTKKRVRKGWEVVLGGGSG